VARAGKRFAIAGELSTVFEYDRWITTRAPIYILDGLHGTGAVTAARGPCDRGCTLMWHEDWLNLEPEPPGGASPARDQQSADRHFRTRAARLTVRVISTPGGQRSSVDDRLFCRRQ